MIPYRSVVSPAIGVSRVCVRINSALPRPLRLTNLVAYTTENCGSARARCVSLLSRGVGWCCLLSARYSACDNYTGLYVRIGHVLLFLPSHSSKYRRQVGYLLCVCLHLSQYSSSVQQVVAEG